MRPQGHCPDARPESFLPGRESFMGSRLIPSAPLRFAGWVVRAARQPEPEKPRTPYKNGLVCTRTKRDEKPETRALGLAAKRTSTFSRNSLASSSRTSPRALPKVLPIPWLRREKRSLRNAFIRPEASDEANRRLAHDQP